MKQIIKNVNYLQISEGGPITIAGRSLKPYQPADVLFAQKVLKNLKLLPDFSLCWIDEEVPNIVECFDFPYFGSQFAIQESVSRVLVQYDLWLEVDTSRLFVDAFDRPLMLTKESQIPVVLLPHALAQLQEKWPMAPSPWHDENLVVGDAEFWTEAYHSPAGPGWDLGAEARPLREYFESLKLQKLGESSAIGLVSHLGKRVLVLGCGKGHDAAYLARLGFEVVGLDFSKVAIQEAKNLYGDIPLLQFEVADLFAYAEMESASNRNFDWIFDHTFYCAIAPSRRQELVEAWHRLLRPKGRVVGLFFSMLKRSGPPYGGSEYELQRRLEGRFSMEHWERARNSISPRLGREFFCVIGRKN